MNHSLIIFFAAILPAFLLVLYIWWKDKHQREPLCQLFKAVLYGIASTAIAIMIEMFLSISGIVTNDPSSLVGALMKGFIGAALPEEGAKLLMLYFFLRNNPYYDERFDGIVYAACISLGFAGTENIFYLFSDMANWYSIAIGRAIFSVPGHFFFGVSMGYFYSKIHFKEMKPLGRSKVLLIPVLLHGLYDSILFYVNIRPIWSTILVLIFYYFCWRMLKYGKALMNSHLLRDSRTPLHTANDPVSTDILEHLDGSPDNNDEESHHT